MLKLKKGSFYTSLNQKQMIKTNLNSKRLKYYEKNNNSNQR